MVSSEYGLLDQVDGEACDLPQRSDGTLWRVGLVGIDGQVNMVANSIPHRTDARDVERLLAAELELEIAIALRHQSSGFLGHRLGGLQRDDARRDDAAMHRPSEQAVQWLAQDAGDELMQRPIDASLDMAVPGNDFVHPE